MSICEATLEQTIDLSHRLSLPERLRLLSILSEELSHQIATVSIPAPTLKENDEEAQLLADLRTAGMLMEPTPEMLARAEEYDAKYSPEEQEAILQELRSLHLDPPLSEIVIRAREFRPGWKWIVEKDEKDK